MVVTLTGENRYLVQSELRKLVNGFTKQFSNFGVERFDGEELEADDLLAQVQAISLFAEQRLIVVRGAGKNKALADKIEHIIDATSDVTELVLVEPQLDKRTAYYKTLKKKTDFKEFNELDERGLSQWLVAEAKERGGQLKPADAQYLVERVGVNQLLLSNELDKLLNYNPTITRETIDLLTEPTPQSTIFELLDTAFSGNAKRTLELYREQRQQKVEPLQILGTIGWQLHTLALVKTARDMSPADIAKEAKLHPFVVRKSQALTSKLSLERIKELVHEALLLDVRLKSESIDPDDALQHYLLTIAQ